MSEPLDLHHTLSSTIIPASTQPRLMYLLLEVVGGTGAESLPGNLGLIIDVSESMRIRLVSDDQFRELVRSGHAVEVMTDGVPAYQITSAPQEVISKFPRRIDYVADALMTASEYLRPADNFSLVAFAGRSYAMIPNVSGKDVERLRQASRELDYLHLGDGTQMAEGIATAYEQVLKAINRSRPTGSQSSSFASRLILLTDGHTLNVNECYEWAKKSRESGIKLSTMGIGSEFNEELLIPLADQTGGNAYYIESPEKIPEAFSRELGSALRVSYRNVEIKLQIPSGIELRRTHRVFPELGVFDLGPNMGGSYSLQLGDYDPAAPLGLLLELIISPRPPGSYRLMQALLAWDDPSGGAIRPHNRQDIVLQVASQATSPLNERVMNIVERVGAFKQGMQALEAAKSAQTGSQQDRTSATVRLREAATRLLDMGESSLADIMLKQADSLEQSGNMDPNATKKLRYETRRMTQHS